MSFIDEISPRFIGEDRLRLTLVNPDQVLTAFAPIVVAVDYNATLPEGTVLPLEFEVISPSGEQILRKVYRRFRPTEVAFTPRAGGAFLVRLAEQYHNQWWGKLVLEIAGDRARGT
jgi:hypothetical protein